MAYKLKQNNIGNQNLHKKAADVEKKFLKRQKRRGKKLGLKTSQ